eukprot:748031-Hanusia_phi.AAC.3
MAEGYGCATGSWKSWIGKDAIKPVNMTGVDCLLFASSRLRASAGCRPPNHCYNAASDMVVGAPEGQQGQLNSLQPLQTTMIGGPNAPFRRTMTSFVEPALRSSRSSVGQDQDTRQGSPSACLCCLLVDTGAPQVFETAASGVRNDPLAAYHPPPDTKVPTTRPEQEPDRWVPMNHNRLSSLYNPLTHNRTEILQVKKNKQVRAEQDVDLIIKKGEWRREVEEGCLGYRREEW